MQGQELFVLSPAVTFLNETTMTVKSWTTVLQNKLSPFSIVLGTKSVLEYLFQPIFEFDVVYKETKWLDGHIQWIVWEPVCREFGIQNWSLLLLSVTRIRWSGLNLFQFKQILDWILVWILLSACSNFSLEHSVATFIGCS